MDINTGGGARLKKFLNSVWQVGSFFKGKPDAMEGKNNISKKTHPVMLLPNKNN